MTKTRATAITGGLSRPSKMPGPAISTPATACKTGAKLASVPGSTCHGCYALKGQYRFSNVQATLQTRLDALRHPEWVNAMVRLLDGVAWFRWHDSGDLQDLAHLRNIVAVARATPATRHWLPTREYGIVRRYVAQHGGFPENLTVRISAHMVDGPAPAIAGLPTSTVHSEIPPDGAHACPAATPAHRALTKDNSATCGPCRACWSRDVVNVSYPLH